MHDTRADAPPSPAPADAPSGFRLDVQGLRGVAVLLVVVYHAGFGLPGGFIGVDVFFVISGFVILRLLGGQLDRAGTLDLRRFYRRRIRRLIPALCALLVIVALLSPLLAPLNATRDTLKTDVAAALIVANFQLFRDTPGYFDAAAESNALLHTWSLSLEEQFYLVIPILLALVAWQVGRRRGRSSAPWLIGAILATSFLLSVVLVDDLASIPGVAASQRFAFFAPMTRAWQFAAGGLLALLPRIGGTGWPRPLARTCSLVGAALIAVPAVQFSATTPFPGINALYPTVGAALLIASGTSHPGGWARRTLELPPLTWLGDRSYSWYLWHWPAIVFAGALLPAVGWSAALGVAVSLPIAAASYRLLEQRFHRRGSSTEPSGSAVRLGIGCVALALAAVAGGWLLNAQVRTTPSVEHFLEAVAEHSYVGDGCETIPLGQPSPCTVERGPNRVALVGDSMAGQYVEAVGEASRQQDRSFELAVFGACPFVDVRVTTVGVENVGCHTFFEQTLSSLIEDPPEVLITSSSVDEYVDLPIYELFDETTQSFTADPVAKRRIWVDAMTRLLDALDPRTEVTIVLPPLKFADWDGAQACAALRVLTSAAGCGATEARATMAERRAAGVEAIHDVTRAFDEVRTIDPTEPLCPTPTCRTPGLDGTWFWRDGHLSIAGTMLLVDELSAVVAGGSGH